MRLYEVLLRNVAKPVGTTLVIFLVIVAALNLGKRIFGMTNQEREFAMVCTSQEGYVKKIEGNHWCVTGGPINTSDGFPSSIPAWFDGCRARGGTIHDPTYNISNDEICIEQEILLELGTLNDFVGG